MTNQSDGFQAERVVTSRSSSAARRMKQSGVLSPAECESQRQALGLSAIELSKRCGFRPSTITEFEAGRHVLSLSAQVAVRRALRKSPKQLSSRPEGQAPPAANV